MGLVGTINIKEEEGLRASAEDLLSYKNKFSTKVRNFFCKFFYYLIIFFYSKMKVGQ